VESLVILPAVLTWRIRSPRGGGSLHKGTASSRHDPIPSDRGFDRFRPARPAGFLSTVLSDGIATDRRTLEFDDFDADQFVDGTLVEAVPVSGHLRPAGVPGDRRMEQVTDVE